MSHSPLCDALKGLGQGAGAFTEAHLQTLERFVRQRVRNSHHLAAQLRLLAETQMGAAASADLQDMVHEFTTHLLERGRAKLLLAQAGDPPCEARMKQLLGTALVRLVSQKLRATPQRKVYDRVVQAAKKDCRLVFNGGRKLVARAGTNRKGAPARREALDEAGNKLHLERIAAKVPDAPKLTEYLVDLLGRLGRPARLEDIKEHILGRLGALGQTTRRAEPRPDPEGGAALDPLDRLESPHRPDRVVQRRLDWKKRRELAWPRLSPRQQAMVALWLELGEEPPRQEALAMLESRGFPMSKSVYYDEWQKIRACLQGEPGDGLRGPGFGGGR